MGNASLVNLLDELNRETEIYTSFPSRAYHLGRKTEVHHP